MSTGTHEVMQVKVNAWVDKGVAPLVLALNEFENLFTVDSCQGGADAPAYVYFWHMGEGTASGRFFSWLGRRLSEWASQFEYELTLDWTTGDAKPMAKISTDRRYIENLSRQLRVLAAERGELETYPEDER